MRGLVCVAVVVAGAGCTQRHSRAAYGSELGRSAKVRLVCGKTIAPSRVSRDTDAFEPRARSSLVMRVGERTVVVPERLVESVETRSRGEGVVMGLLGGALAGLAAGAEMAVEMDDQARANAGSIVLAGVAMGAAIGVLIGAAEGTRHVYRYPDSPQRDCPDL